MEKNKNNANNILSSENSSLNFLNDKCFICPRNCKIDRTKTAGFCGVKNKIKISKVMLHQYEEPIISVGKGSGAIFFAGCNLRCVFCQNYKISHSAKGKTTSVKGLVKIFKKLEKMGAANINLVTPTHYTAQIIEALKLYKPRLPVVWNSSGYETAETIKKLDGLVDIFLVDYKYSNNELALKFSRAKDYVENAQRAILEMKNLQPNDVIENGVMKRGIIVRQLVLPSYTKNSMDCLDFVAKFLGTDTIVSIMSQYEPMYEAKLYPEINRHITPLEYKRVVNHALKLGLKKAYTQDLSSASKIYTPKF